MGKSTEWSPSKPWAASARALHARRSTCGWPPPERHSRVHVPPRRRAARKARSSACARKALSWGRRRAHGRYQPSTRPTPSGLSLPCARTRTGSGGNASCTSASGTPSAAHAKPRLKVQPSGGQSRSATAHTRRRRPAPSSLAVSRAGPRPARPTAAGPGRAASAPRAAAPPARPRSPRRRDYACPASA